jgi:peptidylprolyl isomerase
MTMNPKRALTLAVLSILSLAARAPRHPPAIPARVSPAPSQSMSEILAASPATDWEALDPARTLYMDIGNNRRIIIYLAPFAAPNTVGNIQILAHANYWNGLAIVRMQDNYVVQWGDPNGDTPQAKPAGSVKPKLDAEFDQPILKSGGFFFSLKTRDAYADSVGFWDGFAAARDLAEKRQWLAHCYGAVGVGRGDTADSGNGQELYVVNGHSPRHLDRNVTVVGKVISGMEHLTSLPRGTGPLGFYEKPEQRTGIASIRLASDVPEPERVTYERLDTHSATFIALLKNRRTRKDAWFLHSPNAIDLCNTPLPYRVKK